MVYILSPLDSYAVGAHDGKQVGSKLTAKCLLKESTVVTSSAMTASIVA